MAIEGHFLKDQLPSVVMALVRLAPTSRYFFHFCARILVPAKDQWLQAKVEAPEEERAEMTKNAAKAGFFEITTRIRIRHFHFLSHRVAQGCVAASAPLPTPARADTKQPEQQQCLKAMASSVTLAYEAENSQPDGSGNKLADQHAACSSEPKQEMPENTEPKQEMPENTAPKRLEANIFDVFCFFLGWGRQMDSELANKTCYRSFSASLQGVPI